MFTGIIEGLGTLKSIRPAGLGKRLTIDSDFSIAEANLGDSIAVNGACLTAVVIDGNCFEVDVAPETMNKTAFKELSIGDRLNLERALKLSDRLDGHLVSGHVDGIGIIQEKKTLSNAVIVTVSVPESLTYYMINKGSVAIDGISLTINKLYDTTFEVSIIPHTAKITTIGFKDAGSLVNIETDMIGKYIEKFVKNKPRSANDAEASEGIDMTFLAKSGFL